MSGENWQFVVRVHGAEALKQEMVRWRQEHDPASRLSDDDFRVYHQCTRDGDLQPHFELWVRAVQESH